MMQISSILKRSTHGRFKSCSICQNSSQFIKTRTLNKKRDIPGMSGVQGSREFHPRGGRIHITNRNEKSIKSIEYIGPVSLFAVNDLINFAAPSDRMPVIINDGSDFPWKSNENFKLTRPFSSQGKIRCKKTTGLGRKTNFPSPYVLTKLWPSRNVY